MKQNKTTKHTMVLAAVLTGTAALNGSASADQNMPAAGSEKSYTGVVTSVDPQDHSMRVKSWLVSKREFNLANNCTYALLGVNNGTAIDLRPGQKVTVRFQVLHGVAIADRVDQRPMQAEGMVTAIDFNKHTLTLHQQPLNKSMVIADGCTVALRDNKPGVLGDIQPGDHVTVTYELPNGNPTARQISQTSMVFTGRVTAIDLDEKTVKAKSAFETVKFNLADNCAIVVDGRTDGKLSQLKPDEKLIFNFDTINGVNVVNRIAPAPARDQKSAISTMPSNPGHPTGF
jgi:Cu/Ag efflux protein CusF